MSYSENKKVAFIDFMDGSSDNKLSFLGGGGDKEFRHSHCLEFIFIQFKWILYE